MAEPLLGQIVYVPYRRAPTGWALCDGTLLPIASNAPLFSVIGLNFGGDGRSNFALPNLMNAPTTPKGLLPIICLDGDYPDLPR